MITIAILVGVLSLTIAWALLVLVLGVWGKNWTVIFPIALIPLFMLMITVFAALGFDLITENIK
jgi:hypothetical protein